MIAGPESDAGGGPSAAASADRLLLWAVAGLTGVVIGGRPGSSAAGRSARVPRAVLWGQHAGSLVWRSQLTVICSSSSQNKGCDSHLEAKARSTCRWEALQMWYFQPGSLFIGETLAI